MQDKIHPVIDSLKLSDNAKKYFSHLEFYEIIEDTVIINLPEKNNINEALENQWSFAVEENFDLFTKTRFESIFLAVIQARSGYIKAKYPNVQMKFYTWYESISGNFYFSLISKKEQRLPFGCAIHMYDSLDNVIQEFIDDPYKGKIPLSECTLIKSEGLSIQKEQEEVEEELVLNVWLTVIPKLL
jgi:hypothetical protein